MNQSELFIQQFIAQVEKQILRLAPELAVNLVNTHPGFMVAVSGGSDSTALLTAMSRLVGKHSWRLYAAHVNHGTRGVHSDADADFCRRLCGRLNVEFSCVVLSWPEDAHFSEDRLRQARYVELAQMAQQSQANYLLFAHTLDDQTETMLFHLFRGTGPRGLKGMPERREISARSGSGDDSATVLLRPLLDMCRSDCRRFLEELGQDWVEDSTNAEDSYTRNYIRHNVMPGIERRFPKFQESAARMRQTIAEAEEYLVAATAAALAKIRQGKPHHGKENDGAADEIWSAAQFNAEMPAIRKRLIAAQLKHCGIEVNSERIQMVCNLISGDTTGGALMLSPVLRVKLRSGCVIWESLPAELPAPAARGYTVIFPGVTQCTALNKVLSVTKVHDLKSTAEFPKGNSMEALADFSEAAFPLTIRSRCSSDVIQPLGMKQRVRLKKFIHTRKLPLSLAQRANLMVLADKNEVLWVPGLGISERIRVKNGGAAYRLHWSDIAPEKAPSAGKDSRAVFFTMI